MVNVTCQTKSGNEATDDQPTGKTIKQLAKAYGKNPQWFLGDTGQEQEGNTAGVLSHKPGNISVGWTVKGAKKG